MSILEKFLHASADEQQSLHQSYRKSLKHLIEQGNSNQAIEQLQSSFSPFWDFPTQQAYYKVYRHARKTLSGIPQGFQPLKLAVLGSTTQTQLIWSLELQALSMGYWVEIYEGDYGVFRQLILDPQSSLYEFNPDRLLILTSWRDILRQPDKLASQEVVQTLIEDELADWHNLWATYHQRTQGIVIQNNFDIPDLRLTGNLEAQLPGSLLKFIRDINYHLAAQIPDYVVIHDLDYLTAYYGKRHWYDPRFYHYSKQICSFDALPAYAHSLGQLLAAQLGKGKKCLILDLDNTLWGGIIGDDGLSGIKIGQGTPEGEAHLALQMYAKKLKEEGIMLAVCSKNNLETAQLPFEKLPDMALSLEDFVSFVANWDPKSENIRKISQELNIGLNSMVFVDDNPVERAIVRTYLPEVEVPEMPDDPALYVRTLVEGNYFEQSTLSVMDRRRTEMYQENKERENLSLKTTNLNEFLQQLELRAIFKPLVEHDMERVAQLIQRSNQFNLTTMRRNISELRIISEDPNYFTLTVRLSDRFGDNGLISVWIARRQDDALHIDTWLMSCRVLSRGVEQALYNQIVKLARELSIKRVMGKYVPSQKNELVRDHYEKLGFTKIETTANQTTIWEIEIDASTPLFETHIDIGEEIS